VVGLTNIPNQVGPVDDVHISSDKVFKDDPTRLQLKGWIPHSLIPLLQQDWILYIGELKTGK